MSAVRAGCIVSPASNPDHQTIAPIATDTVYRNSDGGPLRGHCCSIGLLAT